MRIFFYSSVNFLLLNFSQIGKVTYFCTYYTLDKLKKFWGKKIFLMWNITCKNLDLLKFHSSFNFNLPNFAQIGKVTYFRKYYMPEEFQKFFEKKKFPFSLVENYR